MGAEVESPPGRASGLRRRFILHGREADGSWVGQVITAAAAAGVALVALGLVLTPGPNMVYLVSRTLTQGRSAGLLSLAGVATALVVYVVATGIGLSALFVAVPALFTAIQVLGAAYLLHLAWGMVRPSGRNPFEGDLVVTEHTPTRLYVMGVLTCLLNPKIALMYAALLPQFVDPARPPTSQILLLGAVQVVVAVLVNGLWVLAAARIATFLRRRPRILRAQGVLTGVTLAAFAVHVAFEPPPASR